jgi:ubiquitin carboxyl-terminal hydrolase 4/11/15
MTEIFQHKFYRQLENQVSFAEANIARNDDMVIYELDEAPTAPTYTPKRSMLDVDSEPTEAETDVVLPMTMYHLSDSTSSYQSNKFTLWPAIFSLNKEEASSYDEILRKVLITVSNQATADIDDILMKSESESDPSSPTDFTQISDATKSGSDVQTESLDEDYVDVKMANSDEPVSWREKGAPIPDALRDLFKIYFGESPNYQP